MARKRPRKTVQAIVSAPTWDQLVKVANAKDLSVSRVVRGLIEDFVSQQKAA